MMLNWDSRDYALLGAFCWFFQADREKIWTPITAQAAVSAQTIVLLRLVNLYLTSLLGETSFPPHTSWDVEDLLWLCHGRDLVPHPGRGSQLLCYQDAFFVFWFFLFLLSLAASFSAGMGRGKDIAARCQVLVQGDTPWLWLVACQGDWAGTHGLPGGSGFLLAQRKLWPPGPCCCVVHPLSAGQLQKNHTSLCIPAQTQPRQQTPAAHVQRQPWLTMALRRRVLWVLLGMCAPSAPRALWPRARHRQAPALAWWQFSKVAFAICSWQQLLLQSPLGGSGSLARATKCEKRTPKATLSVPLGKAGLTCVSAFRESFPWNCFCHYPFPGSCPRNSWEAANVISKT